MTHLKKFEEISFEDFDSWNQKWNPVTRMSNVIRRKLARPLADKISGKTNKEEEIKKMGKKFDAKDRYFADIDIEEIKDLFFEVQEKYDLEEDPNGKILNYLKIGAPSRRGREYPQFFIENNKALLVFTVASSLSFITPKLLSDIEKFKIRLEKFDKNDILNNIWIKYLSFYITKNF